MDIFASQAFIAEAIKASECVDEGRRATVLLGALKGLTEANKINEAIEILPAIYDFDRVSAITALAPALARNGKLDAALNLTSTLEPGSKAVVLSRIAAELRSTKEPGHAQLASNIVSVQVIGDNSQTDGIWAIVASNLTRSGELSSALDAARKIIKKRTRDLMPLLLSSSSTLTLPALLTLENF